MLFIYAIAAMWYQPARARAYEAVLPVSEKVHPHLPSERERLLYCNLCRQVGPARSQKTPPDVQGMQTLARNPVTTERWRTPRVPLVLGIRCEGIESV